MTEVVFALFDQPHHTHIVRTNEQLVYVIVADVSLAQVGVLYHTVHDGRTDPWYMHDTALVISRTGAAVKPRKLCATGKQ